METKFNYPGLQDDEKVYMVVHRHWIVYLRSTIMAVIMAIMFLAVLVIVPGMFEEIGTPMQIASLAGGAMFLIVNAYLMTSWVDYYHDVFLITNKRIVNAQQSGLFGYKVSEMLLEEAVDITSEKKGFLAAMLGFGNVRVSTSSESTDFCFKDVSSPDKIVSEIHNVLKLRDAYEPRQIKDNFDSI